MSPSTFRPPTEQDAAAIVHAVLGQPVVTTRRFPTGLCHYVYEVVTDSQQLVVRIARPDTHVFLAGGVYWSRLLRPMGLPLPTLVYADLEAKLVPFAFMLLERLPGTDLGHLYHTLTRDEKYAIASDIVRLQAQVSALPHRARFGYANSLREPPPYRTWIDVVHQSLDRSRQRIERAGIVDPGHVTRVRQHTAHFESYLAQVVPTAFLDDTTTKNVIVNYGRLSGVVDVDVVCYGDPLWTVGLTQMALLNQGADLDYITAWTELLHITDEQQAALQFYCAVFCVDFLGELGQVFNKDRVEPHDEAKLGRLISILDDLLRTLKS